MSDRVFVITDSLGCSYPPNTYLQNRPCIGIDVPRYAVLPGFASDAFADDKRGTDIHVKAVRGLSLISRNGGTTSSGECRESRRCREVAEWLATRQEAMTRTNVLELGHSRPSTTLVVAIGGCDWTEELAKSEDQREKQFEQMDREARGAMNHSLSTSEVTPRFGARQLTREEAGEMWDAVQRWGKACAADKTILILISHQWFTQLYTRETRRYLDKNSRMLARTCPSQGHVRFFEDRLAELRGCDLAWDNFHLAASAGPLLGRRLRRVWLRLG